LISAAAAASGSRRWRRRSRGRRKRSRGRRRRRRRRSKGRRSKMIMSFRFNALNAPTLDSKWSSQRGNLSGVAWRSLALDSDTV